MWFLPNYCRLKIHAQEEKKVPRKNPDSCTMWTLYKWCPEKYTNVGRCTCGINQYGQILRG